MLNKRVVDLCSSSALFFFSYVQEILNLECEKEKPDMTNRSTVFFKNLKEFRYVKINLFIMAKSLSHSL